MKKYNIDDPDYAVAILNEAQKKKKYQNTGNDVVDNSINKMPIDYGTKKEKKSPSKIKIAMFSVLGAAVIFTSGMVVHKMATSPKRDFIDNRVDYYIEMMDSNAKDGQRIETAYSYRAQNDSNVDYSIEPLIDNIINASKISESEVRCVILAAYKIINEPYREEILNKTFAVIARNQQLCESLPSYLTMGSWKAYVNSLGYEDTSDYHNNERDNLYKLNEVNANVRGGK